MEHYQITFEIKSTEFSENTMTIKHSTNGMKLKLVDSDQKLEINTPNLKSTILISNLIRILLQKPNGELKEMRLTDPNTRSNLLTRFIHFINTRS